MANLDAFKALAKQYGYGDDEIGAFTSLAPKESIEFPGMLEKDVQKYKSEQALKGALPSPESKEYPGMTEKEVAKAQSEAKLKGTLPNIDSGVGKITAQQANLAKAGLENIAKLKEMYLNDPDLLTKQLVPGQFFSRSFDSALYDTVDALLRLRTGAQANPSEIRGYMNKIAPSFGDSPKDVQYKLQKLENDFKITMGEDPNASPIDITQITFNNQQTGSGGILGAGINVAKKVSNVLLPNATSTGQKVVGSFQDVGDQINALIESEGKPTSVQLPERPRLPKTITNPTISEIPQGVADMTKEAFPAAFDIATTVGIAKTLPNISKGVVGVGKKIVNPFKTVGEMKNAAIEAGKNLKFSGSDIAKAGEEYLKHDPTAKNIARQVLPTIRGKEIFLPDLIKKLDVWNDAYTAAGRVGKSAEAGLYDVLAKTAKKQIAQKAPEVAKANKLFGYLYKAPGTLQKATWLGVKASAIAKLLGF